MLDRDKVLAICKEQNGYKESPAGSNLTKYNLWYYGKAIAAAWCMTSVSWIFFMAGFPLPAIQDPNGAAYVPYVYTYYKLHKKLTILPYKGDIVLYDWNGDKLGDHVGIFDHWVVEGKSFRAWEGNTSPTSDSNGGEYMLRLRYKSQVLAFVNPE